MDNDIWSLRRYTKVSKEEDKEKNNLIHKSRTIHEAPRQQEHCFMGFIERTRRATVHLTFACGLYRRCCCLGAGTMENFVTSLIVMEETA